MAGQLGIPAGKIPGDRGRELAGRELGTAARQHRHQAGDPDLAAARRQRQVRRHQAGQAGELIRKHRERRSKTAEQMAEQLEISQEEYEQIEAGQSEVEEYGPLFLHFAEVIEQPVFNLFYPFGLPLDKLRLEDYR